ncbi:Cytochrome b5-like heme/steroid binding domain [Cinara cedri]|uniref:Cytochrome b5 domain-containing protein 1 n=1 Tax=Cinara cedri TaxID=506608 RepID=A0A5E4NBS7_9HEMI|nr:Cytochrome b5-like heme/steroid binding domain [Cinara cedri]
MSWKNTHFLPEEVSAHNTDWDCWLIIFGVVKNVTGLIERYRGTDLIDPIVREAGRDVTFWFVDDYRSHSEVTVITNDLILCPIINSSASVKAIVAAQEKHPNIKTLLHPETCVRMSALPFRLPDEPYFKPDIDWIPQNVNNKLPWWQDENYNVGLETVRPIEVRVTNPLIKRTATVKVCVEDTVHRIMERYSAYNPEFDSYVVKYLGRTLDMNLDLVRNGVTMKFNDFVEDFIPTLLLHYRKKISPDKNLQ